MRSLAASRVLAVTVAVFVVVVLATSAPARAGEPTTAREARPRSRYAEPGLLGPVRVGPVVSAGFPDGLQLGLVAKGWGWVSVGANAGWLPETKVPIGEDARVVRISGEAFARVHPFRAGLFVGVGLGASQMKGSVTLRETVSQQAVDARARAFVRSVYVTPQLGYQWMFGRNVSAAIRVGVEVPIRSSERGEGATSMGRLQPIDPSGKLADAMRMVARSPVPVVNLLELGVLL